MFTSNPVNWFNAPTRRQADTQESADRAFANTSAETYALTSKESVGCSSTLSPAVAMSEQPGMIATTGYGLAGCEVDTNTELRWGIPGSHRTKGPKQLWSRPFATTPNLGGGDQMAVDDESKLIQSTLVRNRKESATIMDRAIPHVFQPLIDIKASEYKKESNWIEPWTRGGDLTRLVSQQR